MMHGSFKSSMDHDDIAFSYFRNSSHFYGVAINCFVCIITFPLNDLDIRELICYFFSDMMAVPTFKEKFPKPCFMQPHYVLFLKVFVELGPINVETSHLSKTSTRFGVSLARLAHPNKGAHSRNIIKMRSTTYYH